MFYDNNSKSGAYFKRNKTCVSTFGTFFFDRETQQR